jgi:YspA, cpYpsA-related SLOG family
VVITGGARGADTLAVQWAEDRGIPAEVYMAGWEGLGRWFLTSRKMMEQSQAQTNVHA